MQADNFMDFEMGDCDHDLALALQLQEQFDQEYAHENVEVVSHSSGGPSQNTGPSQNAGKELSLVDPQWEVLDPSPDVRAMFMEFNDKYFWGRLAGVEVRWSPRMTLCAGLCCYEGRGGLCSIRLSEPLLKLRPRKDLVETLLHEMIHAYLFITDNNKDHDGHGPEFCKHMNRLNQLTGTNISIYHTFHDEVDNYRQHWWRCNGPCQNWKPYFGYVRRAMNRVPSPRDTWWAAHQQKCGGTFTKIKEPEGYGQKKGKKSQDEKAAPAPAPEKPKAGPDIRRFFGSGTTGVKSGNASVGAPTPGTSGVAKPASSQNGTVKPVSASGNARPVSTSGTVKPVSASGNARPVSTSGTVKPVSTSGNARPVSASGNVKPASTSGNARPVSIGGTVKAGGSGTMKPTSSITSGSTNKTGEQGSNAGTSKLNDPFSRETKPTWTAVPNLPPESKRPRLEEPEVKPHFPGAGVQLGASSRPQPAASNVIVRRIPGIGIITSERPASSKSPPKRVMKYAAKLAPKPKSCDVKVEPGTSQSHSSSDDASAKRDETGLQDSCSPVSSRLAEGQSELEHGGQPLASAENDEDKENLSNERKFEISLEELKKLLGESDSEDDLEPPKLKTPNVRACTLAKKKREPKSKFMSVSHRLSNFKHMSTRVFKNPEMAPPKLQKQKSELAKKNICRIDVNPLWFGDNKDVKAKPQWLENATQVIRPQDWLDGCPNSQPSQLKSDPFKTEPSVSLQSSHYSIKSEPSVSNQHEVSWSRATSIKTEPPFSQHSPHSFPIKTEPSVSYQSEATRSSSNPVKMEPPFSPRSPASCPIKTEPSGSHKPPPYWCKSEPVETTSHPSASSNFNFNKSPIWKNPDLGSCYYGGRPLWSTSSKKRKRSRNFTSPAAGRMPRFASPGRGFVGNAASTYRRSWSGGKVDYMFSSSDDELPNIPTPFRLDLPKGNSLPCETGHGKREDKGAIHRALHTLEKDLDKTATPPRPANSASQTTNIKAQTVNIINQNTSRIVKENGSSSPIAVSASRPNTIVVQRGGQTQIIKLDPSNILKENQTVNGQVKVISVRPKTMTSQAGKTPVTQPNMTVLNSKVVQFSQGGSSQPRPAQTNTTTFIPQSVSQPTVPTGNLVKAMSDSLRSDERPSNENSNTQLSNDSQVRQLIVVNGTTISIPSTPSSKASNSLHVSSPDYNNNTKLAKTPVVYTSDRNKRALGHSDSDSTDDEDLKPLRKRLSLSRDSPIFSSLNNSRSPNGSSLSMASLPKNSSFRKILPKTSRDTSPMDVQKNEATSAVAGPDQNMDSPVSRRNIMTFSQSSVRKTPGALFTSSTTAPRSVSLATQQPYKPAQPSPGRDKPGFQVTSVKQIVPSSSQVTSANANVKPGFQEPFVRKFSPSRKQVTSGNRDAKFVYQGASFSGVVSSGSQVTSIRQIVPSRSKVTPGNENSKPVFQQTSFKQIVPPSSQVTSVSNAKPGFQGTSVRPILPASSQVKSASNATPVFQGTSVRPILPSCSQVKSASNATPVFHGTSVRPILPSSSRVKSASNASPVFQGTSVRQVLPSSSQVKSASNATPVFQGTSVRQVPPSGSHVTSRTVPPSSSRGKKPSVTSVSGVNSNTVKVGMVPAGPVTSPPSVSPVSPVGAMDHILPCPVCQQHVRVSQMNAHLDVCLTQQF